jgi:uncharacterized protein YbjT (DUF2867 family)
MESNGRVLVTGGTGYVGGRLVGELERLGVALRCLSRRPENLLPRVSDSTEVIRADVLDAASLPPALAGVDTAFYLIHSMGTGRDFEDEDRRGARNFALAARQAGVRRIVYLGGLGDPEETLSKHLRSRQEVGAILEESGAQVIEFRASIIIGSGSLSFELVRSLVEKLPVMIWPRWVSTKATPIAIEDVLAYLISVLDHELGESRVYEIGGPDCVSYGDVMMEYARQRGLRRFTIPFPLISPHLSSVWLGLVTPVYARIGRKLVLSLKNPTVVTDVSARDDFDIRPRGLPAAVERALRNEDFEFATTRWSDALSSSGTLKRYGGIPFGNRLIDSRTISLDVPIETAFAPIRRIGGKTGWYYGNWLWKARGFLDLLVGGVGLRRGRRDCDRISVGDTIDCWRVEEFEPDRRLRLAAEMKLPGRAWLEFEILQEADSPSLIRQTAIFDPVGLFGLMYWYGIWPLHQFVFAGMLKGIARATQQSSVETTSHGSEDRGLASGEAAQPGAGLSSGSIDSESV